LARAAAWRAKTSVAISETLWFFYVLVYALDRREPDKRERAREVLRRVGSAGTAALPAQDLSEFGGACLRKLDPRPEAEAIRREVERLMLAFPVLPLTGPVVLEALWGVREHLLSYHDAQIWAVARLGQVGVVLSEEFNPGQYSTGCRSPTRWTPHSASPLWARSSQKEPPKGMGPDGERTGMTG
jgi:predicted nucleic acid-binding protein